jgi:hypothetical protein
VAGSGFDWTLGREELSVNRAFALTIGLLAGLAPAMARAQTNIDQGKSASQIFSNACAECHKSVAALRKGKSAAAVAEFLREHYTTGPQQAASLAAYVVGGRDSVGAPAPGQKPAAEHGQKPPKPEENATANAKPRHPSEADAKPREEVAPGGSFMNPIIRPEPQRPTTATRNRRKDRDQAAPTSEPPQEPAAVARVPAAPSTEPATARPEPMTEPATSETPPAAAPAPAPTAAAPMETPSSESGEPVSRDNIPD